MAIWEKSAQRSCVPFTPFPAMGTSYVTVTQYQNQETDIDKVHRAYSDPSILICTRVCVCVCVRACVCGFVPFYHLQRFV